MTDLTLPGTMDGLLLRTSPVICNGRHRGVIGKIVVAPDDAELPGIVMLSIIHEWEDHGVPATKLWQPSRVALDLRDPTGRVHAAWYAGRMDWHFRARTLAGDSTRFAVLRRLALDGDAMTDDQIGRFRDLCRRLEAP